MAMDRIQSQSQSYTDIQGEDFQGLSAEEAARELLARGHDEAVVASVTGLSPEDVSGIMFGESMQLSALERNDNATYRPEPGSDSFSARQNHLETERRPRTTTVRELNPRTPRRIA